MVRSDRFFGVTAALAIKAPCRAVTTLADHPLNGLADVEGITIVENDRVLVTAQLDPIENGIYNASSSDWQRSADFDGQRDVTKGTIVSVNVPIGTITSYVVDSGIAGQAINIDADPVTFSIFFAQTSSIDDLDDVDTTGCTDDDLMYWSGGVLICTLGALTYDGNELLNDGNIGIKGVSGNGATLRAVASADNVASVNPRRNDQYTGIGGSFGNLDFLHDNNALSSFLGLRLRKQADLFSTREWNVEGISASTTQTQGQSPVKSSLVRVTSVANDNDVITLRSPLLGMDHIIMNRGNNILQVFPEAGDDLGEGTNNSMTVAPGGTVVFIGINTNTWHRLFISSGGGGIGQLGALRGAKGYKTAAFRVIENPQPDIGRITNGPGDGSGGGNANGEFVVNFNAAVYDTDNIHDPVGQPTRFVVPAGITAVEMFAGFRVDDETSTPQAGGLHLRLRKNGVLNGAVDSIFQVTHNNGDPGWIPWDTDGFGMATQDTGGPNVGGSGQAGRQNFSTGTIFVDPGDYLEVCILSQAGLRDIPLNGIWAEMRLLQ